MTENLTKIDYIDTFLSLSYNKNAEGRNPKDDVLAEGSHKNKTSSTFLLHHHQHVMSAPCAFIFICIFLRFRGARKGTRENLQLFSLSDVLWTTQLQGD